MIHQLKVDGLRNSQIARRLHSSLGYVNPNEYEAGFRKPDLAQIYV